MENEPLCSKCFRNLEAIKQYFMVVDYIWEEFGAGDKMLCMDCLEARAGRRMMLNEFTYCITNAIYLAFNRDRHIIK